MGSPPTRSWRARRDSTSTSSSPSTRARSILCCGTSAQPKRSDPPPRPGEQCPRPRRHLPSAPGVGARGREPAVERIPIRVGQKGLDVLGALRRRIVQEEGMLPYVHHENRDVPGDIANLVKRDPVVGQLSRVGILETDGPTDPAHLAYADERRLPDFEGAKALGRGPCEGRSLARSARPSPSQIVEVVLVENHPVVFKTQASRQLRIGRHFLLVDLSVLQHARDMFGKPVRLRDVALVKLEVHLERLVRDAIEPAQVPLPRLVRLCGIHSRRLLCRHRWHSGPRLTQPGERVHARLSDGATVMPRFVDPQSLSARGLSEARVAPPGTNYREGRTTITLRRGGVGLSVDTPRRSS